MTANNTIALIHLFEYNKYQISMFLLELLAKKVCSFSFVSQYRKSAIGKNIILKNDRKFRNMLLFSKHSPTVDAREGLRSLIMEFHGVFSSFQ